MDLARILARITERLAAIGISESALSAKAGSKDMIRNWRRAVGSGQPMNVKHGSLIAIANALDVSVEWLTTGGEPPNPTPQPSPAAGFAEQAVPFTFNPTVAREDSALPYISSLFGDEITPATYRLNVDLPAFALCAGDVLVIDMSRLPRVGELAIARLSDEISATASTLIIRYLPPFLATGTHYAGTAMLRVDDPGVSVRFPVIGTLRGITGD